LKKLCAKVIIIGKNNIFNISKGNCCHIILNYFRKSDQQNDQNQINTFKTADDLNKSIMNSFINSDNIEEMKNKFLKHQQIYIANYEQAESEIKRMDEIYQDLIENVLKVITLLKN
jgi:hypothetical protein